MSKSIPAAQKGVLYIVATPIGNREDITVRALKILRDVDLIAAEDTRKSGKLLSHYRIKNRLVSYHEHNEKKRTPELVGQLLEGTSIALVSNAGTPCVSDPGYRLVAAAVANKIPVIPVPGPSAVMTAVSAAGLPTDSFVFIGFAPKKKGKRMKLLAELAVEPRALIFFESPRRILAFLEEVVSYIGDRPAVLAREMTKLHAEFIRGSVSEILETLEAKPEIKGECTLLVGGCQKEKAVGRALVKAEITTALEKQKGGLSDIAKTIAQKYGLSKKEVYEMALTIRGQKTEGKGQRSETNAT
jgi:16S rRNA (cytidine1402-2'-O)-methyltransferase